MKVLFPILFGILIHFTSYTQNNLFLKQKIDSLYRIDQAVQTDIITAYQNNAGKNDMDSLNKVKEQAFHRHIPLLYEILNEYGLPTYEKVGKESSDNFLAMVNHSFTDISLQEKVAKLGKAEIKKKNISAPALALMIDKMRIKSGRQQLFGSQCDYNAEGVAIAPNLYKPKKVDSRRKKMGLGPLADYLKMMTELHRQMNKRNG